MPGVFLETSAIAECFFKAKKDRVAAFRAIPVGCALVTSRYVIFELCRGYLRYLILLYNKTAVFRTFSDLCRYGQAVRLKTYFQGAIWESFAKFFADAQMYPPKQVSEDEYKLICFRSFLRKDIRYCWQKMFRGVARITNDVGCRDRIEAPAIGANDQYIQELQKHLCGDAGNCGIKAYAASNAADFERLRTRLQSLESPDAETQARIKALRILYRPSTRHFDKRDCYVCGDAIIAHEAPASCPVVSKNKKHLTTICDTFKKELLTIEYQSAGS